MGKIEIPEQEEQHKNKSALWYIILIPLSISGFIATLLVITMLIIRALPESKIDDIEDFIWTTTGCYFDFNGNTRSINPTTDIKPVTSDNNINGWTTINGWTN